MKLQEVLEETERCRVLYMAQAKKVAKSKEARRNWNDAVTDWEEAKTNGGMRIEIYGADQEAGRSCEIFLNLYFRSFPRDTDRVSDEQDYVAQIQESTPMCRTTLLELVDGFPMGSPPSSSVDLVGRNAEIWESVTLERAT